MASLEEGELEDGELLSSDEEPDQGDSLQHKESPSKESTSTPQITSIPKLLELDVKQPDTSNTNHSSHTAHSPEAKATDVNLNETKGSEDGEIFSDDEEAAYYPQHVKSRPRPLEKKALNNTTKHSDAESQKSDSESLSGVRSGRRSRDRYEKDRNLRSSPESESDNIRSQTSDSKEQGLFFEDRDGSETESTGSRERTRSRSRERERDRHSSPKYGGGRNRNRERDRGNRTRNDDDSSDDREQQYRGGGSSSYYGRQSGGYGGRTRGGYGGYQQRGGYGSSKFQVGGASGGGGYTSSVQPGLMNTGMTAQQFHALASKVKRRREDGLPLLPQPNLDKCGNLDQYNYPAPPSWYLEELEAWEKREKEREKEEKMTKEGTVVESTEQATKPQAGLEESKESRVEIVTERKRPISPLFRRTSSVALEIVSSPVSDDDEPSLEVIEDESEPADKGTETASSEQTQPEKAVDEPMETAISPTATAGDGPTAASDGATSTTGVRPLKELAAIVVQTDTTKPTSPTTTITVAITTISTSVTTTSASTTGTAATTTTALATTTTSTTESASQSLPDASTSTAMRPQSPAPPSDSTHLSDKGSPTKPIPAPLTISTKHIEVHSDHSHSPSLSPTIPIQSGSQTKGAPSLHPKGVFRPKIMSDSESEGDYDDYLDQLDEEEDDVIATKNSKSLLANTLSEGFPIIGGSSAPSLTSLFKAGNKAEEVTNQVVDDPFSEDFPAIGKDTERSSSKQHSLMSLIAGDQEVVDKDTDHSKTQGEKKSKSSRRKLKDLTWWTKQKEREKSKQAASEESKKTQPCKYFLNGNCKNGDSCAYSHDCAVQKKKEICKYYIQGYCSKGELCHYYHETFPCKYMHTKGYCKNGEQCRFSHAPLTPEAKELLITVLDPSQISALNTNLSGCSPSTISPSPELTSSLVVSIPKDIVKGLIVSIPLNKLQKDYSKRLPSTPPPNAQAPSNVFPPTATSVPHQQYQNQPPPRGPFPFQQQSGNPVPFLQPVGRPGQYGAPPPAPPINMQPQSGPIPLFPPKQQNQFQPQGPPAFPPPHQPPPTSGPRMPHPPTAAPPPSGPGQRRSLLPTPPPHMMLTPDDLKRMESANQQEYWEAPELNQQNPPYHYNQPAPAPPQAPPMGGVPPYNSGPLPPGQQFSREGFPPHAQGPPPGPFPPQHQYRQPPPQQFGAPPPVQQQAPPTFHPPGPMQQRPPPPHAQWGEQRPQPGMEQRHPAPPPGMDPRHNQSAGPPFPSSRVDPRHQQPGGPMNPPQGNDPWRPANIHPDQMPPPIQQQQDGSHWNVPPSGPPPMNAPPSYQRPPPPSHQQNSSMPAASGLAPFQQSQPPYQSHNAMSPPSNTRYPMPPQQPTQVGGASQAQAPLPGMDKASHSPTWRTSPEYSGSQSPSGSAGDHTGRRDPRTKYAHLKIKSKGQTSSTTGQSNSQPILKRSAGEAGMDVPASGFKIPKLLQDSSSLNRPMDPGELFGGKDALSVGDERERGPGITTPFGAFRSMFPQAPSSESEENNAESASSSQKFGEITMETDQPPAKAKDEEVDEEKEALLESTKASEIKDSNSSSKPAEVPSYLAHLNMGLGDDLKIDSAFGSLSEKSTKDEGNSEKTSQDSQARKLPSIFGFS